MARLKKNLELEIQPWANDNPPGGWTVCARLIWKPSIMAWKYGELITLHDKPFKTKAAAQRFADSVKLVKESGK